MDFSIICSFKLLQERNCLRIPAELVQGSWLVDGKVDFLKIDYFQAVQILDVFRRQGEAFLQFSLLKIEEAEILYSR